MNENNLRECLNTNNSAWTFTTFLDVLTKEISTKLSAEIYYGEDSEGIYYMCLNINGRDYPILYEDVFNRFVRAAENIYTDGSYKERLKYNTNIYCVTINQFIQEIKDLI